MTILNEKTFIQRALHCYDNPQCISLDEFKSDLDRFGNIRKIFYKYLDGTGSINERLVLNHLVICFNVFGNDTLDLAFYKLEDNRYWGLIIPYFIFLNRIPDDYLIRGKTPVSDISLNKEIVEALRNLSPQTD